MPQRLLCAFLCLPLLFLTVPAAAQDLPQVALNAALTQTNVDYVWTILAAAMVFFMQAGFALVETGFTRLRNGMNIIMKNLADVTAGALVFFAVGFGLMFGSSLNGWIGTDGFFLLGIDGQERSWIYAFFFFQAVFAATAATIVSGAVAERTRFVGYLLSSVIVTGFVYPVFGSWAWGGLFNGSGWLEQLGFIDFAGSTVVHSVGGWAALAGALVVGPRTDKYADDGSSNVIPGHSLPLAALGVFILWFGWFGFNAGSTTAGSPDISGIVLNTFLAAVAGALGAFTTSRLRVGVASAPLTLNGILAGLVGITAGCATLSPGTALLTGWVAGVLLVFSTDVLDRIVDDPVGAVAVHGIGGVWGTLAAGLFAPSGSLAQIGVQLLGIGAAFLWAFPTSYIAFRLVDAAVGLRVEEDLFDIVTSLTTSAREAN
mgnify:CR=1 FL=1